MLLVAVDLIVTCTQNRNKEMKMKECKTLFMFTFSSLCLPSNDKGNLLKSLSSMPVNLKTWLLLYSNLIMDEEPNLSVGHGQRYG